MILAVWGVAPSCWNHCSSRCTPQRAQSVPKTCWEPRCNALYKPSLSLQHHSPTKTVPLCHVSIWQPMQCTLQSAVISEGLHVVLEIPRTQSSCCWHGLIERSGLHHWTTHSEENLDFLQSYFGTTGTSQHVLSCHFVWEFVWSGFCMGTTEGHSSRSCERMNEKDPTLEGVSEWLFWTPPHRISHCVDILWGSCSQVSTTCWFLSFFCGLYQCSCVLELLYPASNLELKGKVLENKPSAVSRLGSLQWFRLQIEGHTKCFFLYWSCHLLDQMKCYYILYQSWKTQNESLILAELLTSKWDMFITRHPVDSGTVRK